MPQLKLELTFIESDTRLVGESAFILAVAAIYLTTLDSFGKITVHPDMYIVVILYCVFYALFQGKNLIAHIYFGLSFSSKSPLEIKFRFCDKSKIPFWVLKWFSS